MAKPTQNNTSKTVNILNVGTRILLRDSMDQYIRTLGDYRTYYASTLSAAMRNLNEHNIHILISEVDYTDGSAFRLLKNLNWLPEMSNTYVILAIEEKRPELLSLAEEMEVQSILVKPFNATDLKYEIEKYEAWVAMPKQPWQLLVKESIVALKERRYRDAEQFLFEAVKAAPTNPTPAVRAGSYYLQKLEFSVAEKLLTKAIELKSDYVQAISLLGTLYRKKREYEQSEEFFRKAHTISPLNPDRLLELIKVQTNWSIEMCRTTLKIDPGYTAARIMLAKLLTVDCDYVSAIYEGEAALQTLEPDHRPEIQTFIALARKLGGLAK